MTPPARESRLIFLAGVALFGAAAWHAVFVLGAVSADAVVRTGQALDVLAGTDAGRQSLVCSPWRPPLPALLHVPLVFFGAQTGRLALSCLMSALFGAGTLVFLGRIFARAGVPGPSRAALLCAVAVHPAVVGAATSGADAALVLFLSAGVLDHLLAWTDGRRTSDFLLMTAGAALLATAAPEGAFYAAALLCAVVGAAVARRTAAREVEALVLLFLAPAVYLVSLWFLFNWLVLGDALYFLRGWLVGPAAPAAPIRSPGEILRFAAAAVPAFGAGLVIAAAGCVRRGRTARLPAILFTAVPAAFCAAAGAAGLLPDPLPVLVPLAPFAAVLAVSALERDDPRWARSTACALVALLLVRGMAGAGPYGSAGAAGAGAAAEVREVEAYVARNLADGRVFVTDFAGYRYRFHSRSGLPVAHRFDFRPEAARTSSVPAFLVAARPRGIDAFDGVHRRYPDLYAEGAGFAVLEREFENWRIFRIVPAP